MFLPNLQLHLHFPPPHNLLKNSLFVTNHLSQLSYLLLSLLELFSELADRVVAVDDREDGGGGGGFGGGVAGVQKGVVGFGVVAAGAVEAFQFVLCGVH